MKFGLVSFVLPYVAKIGSRISSDVPDTTSSSSHLFMTNQKDSTIPIKSTLIASQLVYGYGYLRDIIIKHEKTFNENLSDKEKKTRPLVEFVNPTSIIVNPDSKDDNVMTNSLEFHPFESAQLEKVVTAGDVLKFLEANKGYFEQGPYEDIKFYKDGNNEKPIYMADLVKQLDGDFGDDGEIIEFDDDMEKELVHAIVLNRSAKRITVVFKGTDMFKEWLVNLRVFPHSTPFAESLFGRKPVTMHRGFYEYLLGKSKKKLDENSKLNKIIKVLRDVYNNDAYKDYQLCVTGHSLGGALTQLFSSVLAAWEETDLGIPKPVTAITFASPHAGKDCFLGACKDLERNDKLRHIRISNQNDVVPVGYSLLGFRQTGVNIHLKDKEKAEVAYANDRGMLSQLSFSSIDSHDLFGKDVQHEPRLYAKDDNGEFINKDVFFGKTVEQLYEEVKPW